MKPIILQSKLSIEKKHHLLIFHWASHAFFCLWHNVHISLQIICWFSIWLTCMSTTFVTSFCYGLVCSEGWREITELPSCQVDCHDTWWHYDDNPKWYCLYSSWTVNSCCLGFKPWGTSIFVGNKQCCYKWIKSAIPLWLAWQSHLHYFSPLSGSLLQDITPCFQLTKFLQTIRKGLLLLGKQIWKKCASQNDINYENVTRVTARKFKILHFDINQSQVAN